MDKKKCDNSHVKTNQQTYRLSVHLPPAETSKFQIVQDLNMGLSTVSQNLTTLEKEGLIERNGYFASTGGRKAQIIRIVQDLRIAIGIGILKNMFHLKLRWICTGGRREGDDSTCLRGHAGILRHICRRSASFY